MSAGPRVVSTDELVEELWGDHPPSRTANALQAHVSRIRRKLHSLGSESACALTSEPTGYRLLVNGVTVDADVFMRTVKEGGFPRTQNVSAAVSKLRAGLALWRGPVFGGPIGGPLCQAAAERYDTARVAAYEMLFDLELQEGHHAQVVAELSEVQKSTSLNERFCEQLMVALYRSGRQAEALSAYRQIQQRLDADLGVLPSPTLRRHLEAILTHDPILSSSGGYQSLRG